MNNINLPDHWKLARLGEVTEIIKGGTPNRSVERYFQGDIAWAIPSDITALDSALYIHDTASHISKEGLSKSAAKPLPSGTVLLTSRATIGETAISTVPMATNQGFANFICKDMLSNIYLAYYLRYVKQKLIALASGSTFKEITKGTLLRVEIPLPPFPEQRAIAHVLQTIQEAKATRQREIALERERKAVLMDSLFSQGTKGEPRKQTEIGEIPESWEVVRLEDVCTFTTGKLNSEKAVEDGQYPFFTCSQETFKIDSYSFDQEALLLSGNNARGIFSVKYYKGKFDAYQRTYVITIKDTKQLSYQYFLYDLSLKLELLRKQSIGATTKYLTASIIRNLGLTCPPLSEQHTISSVLWSCDEKIATLEREVELMDELFHATLDELMTGRRSAVPLIESGVIQ